MFFPERIFIPSMTRLPELMDQPSWIRLSIIALLCPLIPNVLLSPVRAEIFTVHEPINALHQEKSILPVMI